MRPIQLPKNTRLESNFGKYQSSYKQIRQKIFVTRTLELIPISPVLESTKYAELYEMSQSILHDLKAQILY